ncbi:unnamed protein product [Microthlaspi erraticum]|uniref:Uncharacterized protein n=1 Tax=Microthlaspi erraticum TaxID=1685480 RepID=A0A6D2HG90_9BRAS|nr:unnamed protein product [Microthlaspi erraticum]
MGKIDDLADVLHGTVAALTDRVDKMQGGWDQLKEAHNVVTDRMDAMDRNLSRIMESLSRIEGNRNPEPSHRNRTTSPTTMIVRYVILFHRILENH